MLLVEGRPARLTAFAGTKTRPLGVGRGIVKADIAAFGETGGAGRSAINPGGRDRIVELAVEGGVARDHGFPSGVIARGGGTGLLLGADHAQLLRALNVCPAIRPYSPTRTPILAFKSSKMGGQSMVD